MTVSDEQIAKWRKLLPGAFVDKEHILDALEAERARADAAEARAESARRVVKSLRRINNELHDSWKARYEEAEAKLNQIRAVYLAFDSDEISTRDQAFRVVEDLLRADDPDLLPRLGREINLIHGVLRTVWDSRRSWQDWGFWWRDRARYHAARAEAAEAKLAAPKITVHHYPPDGPPSSPFDPAEDWSRAQGLRWGPGGR